MRSSLVSRALLAAVLAPGLGVLNVHGASAEVDQLFPGTAILVTPKTGSGSGSGGSGSSMTNTFSPPAYVDYKRIGGEPTVAVDRYPFRDPTGTTTTYRDTTYVSSPLGVGYPGYSLFWKSTDLGQTFRLPPHAPLFGKPATTAPPTGGGADSHQAIGQVTHRVFFADLSAYCVTVNTSDDFGETFTPDELGCGLNPGAIDDRQWIDVDELAATPNAYLSFINFTNTVAPTLSLARSTHDGQPGSFVTDSVCNTLTMATPPVAPAGADPDAVPTACPDPADTRLWVAGPVVADKSTAPTGHHTLYIPFVRASGRVSGAVEGGPPYDLLVARSTDNGTTWTRQLVASLGVHNPANIFPQLTVDNGGNVYVTWAQTQGDPTAPDLGGETDVYYAWSPPGGLAWTAPIDLTQETGDSAVFPWMVAGDPGRVDLVFYKSSTGLNPNVAAVDNNGQPCDEDLLTELLGNGTCRPNPSVWNVYFAQSLNALNPGSNFKTSQISDHAIHRGQVCTAGLNCITGGNRNLLDFFTVDVDHLGAANVVWSDDNNSRNDTRNKFSRQLSGSSVFANQNINLQNVWPIKDHSATDPAGDVFSAAGAPAGSCPGMDVLAASTKQSGDQLTLSLTLNAPPTAAAAVACSGGAATGGLWGAEFWAASTPDQTTGGGPNDNFYLAYRDNPLDGGPGVEAGRMNSLGVTATHDEFHRIEPGTLGGTCFTTPPPLGACTITMTASLTGLGIKPGAALNSVTGLSVYYFGSEQRLPALRVPLGFSEQADVVVAYEDTGTTTL